MLEHQKLNDLVYVYYNLHLQDKYKSQVTFLIHIFFRRVCVWIKGSLMRILFLYQFIYVPFEKYYNMVNYELFGLQKKRKENLTMSYRK